MDYIPAENTVARMEIDNHADTTCFGSNFIPLYFTGQVCDVSPYLNEYEPMPNVRIAGACTAYDDPKTGLTVILEYHQGLWFGTKMTHSLINPNQCRSYGLSICDDPYDPHRDLGIYDPVTQTFIPLDMMGTIACVTTRAPTWQEIQDCPRVVMTDDADWDPSTLELHPRSKEEEEYKRIIASVRVNSVDVNANPSEPQVFQSVHESDVILSSVSSALSDETMVPRLVASVKIATYMRNDDSSASSVATKGRHSAVNAEELSRKWGIGLETARKTLKVTTQYGIRHALHPLRRRYRTDHMSLRYRRLRATFYTDTLFSKVTSIKGNKCAQVYCSGNFLKVQPMVSKSHVGQSLQDFADDIGIMDELVVDGASEQTGPRSEFMRTVRFLKIKLRQTEPYSPWQNDAERKIGEVKKHWRHRMVKKKVPRRLWDYGLVYEAEIMSRVSRGPDGRTGIEEITGDTPDISEWLDFDFYDLVWYWDAPHLALTEENPKMGRWLGVSHRVGSDMCYWIINEKGNVLARTTVQHVPELDLRTDQVKQRAEKFEKALTDRLNDANFIAETPRMKAFTWKMSSSTTISCKKLMPSSKMTTLMKRMTNTLVQNY